VDKQTRYGTAVGVCDGVQVIGGREISGTSGQDHTLKKKVAQWIEEGGTNYYPTPFD
jgi:hypothetical protein